MEIKPCPKCGKTPTLQIVEEKELSAIVKLFCNAEEFVDFIRGWQEVTHQEVMVATNDVNTAIAEAIILWNERCEE